MADSDQHIGKQFPVVDGEPDRGFSIELKRFLEDVRPERVATAGHPDDSDAPVFRTFHAFNIAAALQSLQDGIEILPANPEVFDKICKGHAATAVARQSAEHRALDAGYVDVLLYTPFVQVAASHQSEEKPVVDSIDRVICWRRRRGFLFFSGHSQLHGKRQTGKYRVIDAIVV